MIYLDYAAATPPDDSVLDTFYQVTKKYYANPNSSHKLGLDSKKLMDDTTLEISNLLVDNQNFLTYNVTRNPGESRVSYNLLPI